MKKIDIEQWERKNPDNIPDDFFQKMQENVLSQTIHTHKTTPQEEQRGTDFSKKWIWLAAAVVLVLGLFWMLPNGETEIKSPKVAQLITSTKPQKQIENSEQIVQTSHPDTVLKKPTNSLAEVTLPTQKIAHSAEVSTTPKAELMSNKNIDQVLAVMSEKELSELGNRNYQDVYLDVYY